MIASQTISYAVRVVLCNDPRLGDFQFVLDQVNQNWTKILCQIFLTFSAAEAAFIFARSLLHTHPSLMKFHVFYHCCATSSLSTNFLFHPVDLAIEFAGPFICLLAVHYLSTAMTSQEHGQVTLLITYTTFQLWYAYDHDEHMNLYHSQHHKTCDSVYSVYIRAMGDPTKNLLQKKLYSFSSSPKKGKEEDCPMLFEESESSSVGVVIESD